MQPFRLLPWSEPLALQKKMGGGVLVVEEGEQKEKGEKGLARSDNAHSQTAGLECPPAFSTPEATESCSWFGIYMELLHR